MPSVVLCSEIIFPMFYHSITVTIITDGILSVILYRYHPTEYLPQKIKSFKTTAMHFQKLTSPGERGLGLVSSRTKSCAAAQRILDPIRLPNAFYRIQYLASQFA